MATKTKTDYRTELFNLCRALAEDAHRQYCQNLYTPLYLVGVRDSRGAVDHIRLADDPTELEELLANEFVPRHFTAEQNADWIRQILNHTPLAMVLDS